ncbi:MAG: hypothetical protein HZA15_09840 [Nitrospirae bacterium]|nr:hypothetical protein [Nitrospirota bacterium]
MRFLYYDRVISIEKGRSITGTKAFPLSEEFFRRHFTRKAIVPGVICLEAMAQLLGWLIIYSHDFRLSAIMSLVEGVSLPAGLRPGFTAEIHAELLSTSRRDSLGKARIMVDGEIVASVERLIFSHVANVDRSELMARFSYYSGMPAGSLSDTL